MKIILLICLTSIIIKGKLSITIFKSSLISILKQGLYQHKTNRMNNWMPLFTHQQKVGPNQK